MSDHDDVGLVKSDQYQGPERRMEFTTWRQQVERRLHEGGETMRALRTELEENTKLTKNVEASTRDLVGLLESFRGAFKVLDMLGRAAKPLSFIVMLGGSLWGLFTAIKGGGEPPK